MTQPDLTIYPAPVEEEPATDYVLTINGQPVFTYRARVSAQVVNQVWPGYQRPLEQTEIASFASWDMAEPAEVSVVSRVPVVEVRMRPSSSGIEPVVEGNTIRFTIQRPGQYTVEVNGTHHALHLFANPAASPAPDPEDPDVIYFGPGVHCPGIVRPQSHQTVYIAGGAVVYGAIAAEHAEDITICGRGILDGSKFSRHDSYSQIFLGACAGVVIDGITLRDSNVFSITPVMCRQVHISNVKLIGNWRYNSDGIDFVSCQHCSVEDSFVRTFDDSIVFKGYENWGPFVHQIRSLNGVMEPDNFTADGVTRCTFAELQKHLGIYPCRAAPVRDMHVRRCVVWNDWGRALEIGAETVATEFSDISYEDCDIIHMTFCGMSIQNSDRALCRDITYQDIRVELDGRDHSVISLENLHGWCSHDRERGRIEGIAFRDIEVTGPGNALFVLHGFDAEHRVQRVSIENLRVDGQVVTSLASDGFRLNEFVGEVSVVSGSTG